MKQLGWGQRRPARFPRCVRLRRSKDFERVKSLGQVWRHPLFVLAKYPNGQALSRVGIVAGRKVGRAVARNRAKRLLREAARRLREQMLSGWDIVLIARPAIVQAQAQQVYIALAELARRAGLMKVQG